MNFRLPPYKGLLMASFMRLSIVMCLLGTASLPAREDAPRQYYSNWRKHGEKPYYYRWYYFKPAASDKEYQYHYGIYYPSRGKRVYLYNPQAKKFWGFYDMEAKGYSLLPPEKRRERIDDIPAEAFPKPGKMPPLPDSKDGTAMLPPPDDLPKVEDLPS
jgi:hypothetical protein